jgi:hypothetical protein
VFAAKTEESFKSWLEKFQEYKKNYEVKIKNLDKNRNKK